MLLNEYEELTVSFVNDYLANFDIYTESNARGLKTEEIASKKLAGLLASENTLNANDADLLITAEEFLGKVSPLNLGISSQGRMKSILNDRYSLLFAKIEKAVPIEESTAGFSITFGRINSPSLKLYAAEMNAVELEKMMKLKRGQYLGSEFIGLLNDLDMFETIIESFFWGSFITVQGIHQNEYQFDVDGIKTALDNEVIPSFYLRDALYACIVHMPALCMDNIHPFFVDNMPDTLNSIKKANQVSRKNKTLFSQKVTENRKLVDQLLKSQEYFYRDLGRYLKYKFLS